ncbi:MAG TPA: DUF2065 domain-containing protein [Burkholderiales bacterium]|nr:DUF2065 domain-containing protein [Burkholderiales bacterium]
MLRELGVAIALLLILEGVLPFLSPTGLRNLFLSLARMNDSQLRFAGFTSMLLGVVLLYILR